MVRPKPILASMRTPTHRWRSVGSTIALGAWSGKPIRAWWLIALLSLVGCDQSRCLLHSDCKSDEVCLSGTCRESCGDDLDCPIDRVCTGGGCLLPDPNARFECEDDSGCTDGGDASVATDGGDVGPDVVVPPADGAPPPPDAGTDAAPSDADVGPPTDVAPPDAYVAPDALPPPIDLSGVYAVRHRVTLTSSREFSVGDEAHTIVTLIFLRGSIYRMEVRDQQGTELFVVQELDFASPDPGTYQFEYPREDPNPPEGCTHTDVFFQRGEFSGADGFLLDGDEDLSVEFGGEACGEEDAVVQQRVEWRPVPRP